MAATNLTPGAVESELTRMGDVSRLVAETEKRLEEAKTRTEEIRSNGEVFRRQHKREWSSVMRYERLRESGVGEKNIRGWERLIAEAGLSPALVTEELLANRDLGKTLNEKTRLLKEIETKTQGAEAHVSSLESELAKLEIQRGEITRSIDTVTQATKNSVQVIADDATEKVGAIKDKAGKDLKRLSSEARKGLDESADAASKKVEEANETLEGFKTKVEDTYNETLRTGETIGRQKALGPLVEFVTSGKGDPGQVVPLFADLSEKLASWASTNSSVTIKDKAEDLAEALNDELKFK